MPEQVGAEGSKAQSQPEDPAGHLERPGPGLPDPCGHEASDAERGLGAGDRGGVRGGFEEGQA